MNFNKLLRKSLDNRLGKRVKYFKNWDKNYTGPWRGPSNKPVALVLHHTAGAATTSTDPRHKGNQPGANNGVVNFVQNHYRVPAANFTIDRDGTVFTHATAPVWHAGSGKFSRLSRWNKLKVPASQGNRWMLGVELISKGRRRDFTEAQIKSLVDLTRACRDAAGWENTSRLYLPRHKDWARGRKVDIVYTNTEVQKWFTKYPENNALWDGKVPRYDAVMNAQDKGYANPAAYRLACRLADLGFYKGTPAPRYTQKYPRKAVKNYQKHYGFDVPVPGDYGPVLHRRLFGEKP